MDYRRGESADFVKFLVTCTFLQANDCMWLMSMSSDEGAHALYSIAPDTIAKPIQKHHVVESNVT